MSLVQDPLIRDIPDFPNYQISEYGVVYNKKNGKEIKGNFNNNAGYIKVCLSKDNKKYNFNIHRLLGIVFLDNFDNKPCIDHINRDRRDNRLENLRWVSYSENMKNCSVNKLNNTGVKGLNYANYNGCEYWRISIRYGNGKRLYRTFSYTEEGYKNAVEQRLKWEQELWCK